jgi:ribosomal protein S18 acetylase RimI-like enzyme
MGVAQDCCLIRDGWGRRGEKWPFRARSPRKADFRRVNLFCLEARLDHMMTTVRKATESDQAALAALLTSLGEEGLDDIGIVIDTTPVPPEHVGAVLRFLGSQGTSVLLAECDGTLAGFLLLACPDDSADMQYGGVTMAVARDCRRQGIGSALLAAAQRMVETNRLGGLRLEVRRNNQPAIHLYKKLAFEVIDETETDLKMGWQNKAAAH